jgi:tight adherence protein C
MSMTPVLGSAALSGAALSLWLTVAGDRRSARKAAMNLRAGLDTTDLRQHHLAEPASTRAVLPAAQGVLAALRRLTPAGSVERLNASITRAGMSATWPLERTLTAKLLLGVAGTILGLLLLSTGTAIGFLYGVSLPPLLFFGPNIVLSAKARQRQRLVRIAMPDTLDQITVCVEAGLGFEAAMARAARTGEGPLAEELLRTLQDVQLGVPRKEAIRGMAERTDVDELRQFVSAILQAEGYGVPIARVLRIQAGELREKRRQEAEERAMKISIKMLFPLVTCILPSVFIIILGPAVFRLTEGLSGGG